MWLLKGMGQTPKKAFGANSALKILFSSQAGEATTPGLSGVNLQVL